MGIKVDFDSLLDDLAERVAAKLSGRLAGRRGTVEPRLLSIEQASLYLGRTKDAMHHLVSAGKIPVVRCDHRVFVDIEDLDRWVEIHKHAGS